MHLMRAGEVNTLKVVMLHTSVREPKGIPSTSTYLLWCLERPSGFSAGHPFPRIAHLTVIVTKIYPRLKWPLAVTVHGHREQCHIHPFVYATSLLPREYAICPCHDRLSVSKGKAWT